MKTKITKIEKVDSIVDYMTKKFKEEGLTQEEINESFNFEEVEQDDKTGPLITEIKYIIIL